MPGAVLSLVSELCVAECHAQVARRQNDFAVCLACRDACATLRAALTCYSGVVWVGWSVLIHKALSKAKQCSGRGRNAVMSQPPLEFLVSLRACGPDGDVGIMSGLLSILAADV